MLVDAIFNAAIKAFGKPNRDRWISLHKSTNQLLSLYMRNVVSREDFARRRAALNIWERMI